MTYSTNQAYHSNIQHLRLKLKLNSAWVREYFADITNVETSHE